jgi:hypothetical protein
MTKNPEAPTIDLQTFDKDFFAAYEEQLSDIRIEDQAILALTDIISIRRLDGTDRSYKELVDETSRFFANDWVKNDEAIINRLVTEGILACSGHAHNDELSPNEQLSFSIFDMTTEHSLGETHNHDHNEGTDENEEDDDDEYEIDATTGKRVRKKRRGWFGSAAK